jgi:D-3-phosphoglycerate dehydrogenase
MLRVLYLSHAPAIYTLMRELLPRELELITLDQNSDADRWRLLPEADVLLVAETHITAAMTDRAARLRLVQHQGVGYEKIDLDALARRGIPLCLTPEGTSVGVAEHTVLLMLAVYKHLLEADQSTRRGEWKMWSMRLQSFELAGKTVGLVGLGRIGREVARRLVAFDTRVLYCDPLVTQTPAELPADRVQPASFDDLLARSDIVSNHTPSTSQTKGLYTADVFRRMKPGAVFINTSRGDIVEESALAAALRSGHLLGAGLDVFRQEPPPAGDPLFALPNIVLTPHISAGTADALRAKLQSAFGNMARFARGEPLRHEVGRDIR